MQKLSYIIKAFLILSVFSLVACERTFEEINTNPNAFNTAQPENLMAGAIKSTLDLVGGDMNMQMALNYGHYIGGVGGQFPRFFFTESRLENWWNDFYVDILKNLQEIIDRYDGDPEYANRVQIAKIWKSYVYSVMVSTFGGVPMSEALSVNTSVGYDSEEEVLTAILDMLKEAAETIDPGGDALAKDPIFNGNNGLWIKFANTLRLKIALRISEGFPTLAETHVREVMTNEDMLISSNGNNVKMSWGLDEENWSHFYRQFVFSGTSLQYPKVNHFFMMFMKTYADPRVHAFADPSIEPLTILDSLYETAGGTTKVLVSYEIPFLGEPLASANTLSDWDLPGADNPLSGIADENYSNLDLANFLGIDMDYMIITAAETNFMKAEAAQKGWGGSKSAEEYYNGGIDASFDQYGIDGAADYKEQDGIKWGTSSEGDRNFNGIVTSGISADPMEKIVYQRWIAGFFQGHDAWCLQKRTRIIDFPPHLNPEQSRGLDYSDIPERMVYSTNEMGINATAYGAAVSALGGPDDLTTPLKMNKSYTPTAWETVSAEFNWEFGSFWYGNSIEDLEAAGVSYIIQ